jgi:hypothetical protein
VTPWQTQDEIVRAVTRAAANAGGLAARGIAYALDGTRESAREGRATVDGVKGTTRREFVVTVTVTEVE